jgi:uncharacterized protein YbjT (DUF2867 family)
MKVLLFGATGMVGQGVLRECLLDEKVELVTTIGRHKTGKTHPKLQEIEHQDLFDYSTIEAQLTGFDACFFCLGISSFGMKEKEYRHITYDLTLAAANALVKRNPGMVFTYVSGTGTDSTEKGRVMWARVKGETENALLRLPFKAAYMFRPGMIQALHGVKSKTKLYRMIYPLFAPLFPILNALFPHQMTTTEKIGRAMLWVVQHGAPKPILESRDFNGLVN